MRAFLPFVVVGLGTGSVYGLAGLGLVLTYKTSGIFNFAHGTVAAAMAYAFFEMRERHGWPWPIALLVCVVVLGPLVGLALERMARRLADAPTVAKIVATLGLVVGIQQLAVIRYGAATRQFRSFLPTRVLRLAGVNVGYDQLIVMGIALASAVALFLFFRSSRLGLGMRGVVDNADLLGLTGTNPVTVRRWAWAIGSGFAALSGILLAPSIGLDSFILTLLVVQAFGAAAVGLFTSLPLTYLGGLGLGVGSALATRYVASVPWLRGVPTSLPFIVLFTVLVLVPRRQLVDIVVERRPRLAEARRIPLPVAGAGTVAGLAAAIAVPLVVGTKLVFFSTGLVDVIVFLSLALLVRTSGQVSLAQLALAAVGASSFSHFAHGFGMPWLVAVLLAGVVAIPVGAIVAIPAIRLSGLYLALATLGFGLLMEQTSFSTRIMFGYYAVNTPRPSFAQSDRGYYYVILAFALAAVALVAVVRRSRLGRLLRGMADSPLALSTYGTNVTVIKVLVFCISAFLAGIAGALLGPITGQANQTSFATFSSLLLVVVLVLQGPVGEIRASLLAAAALAVLPGYVDNPHLNQYFPVLFGVGAIAMALAETQPAEGRRWPLASVEECRDRIRRSAIRARTVEAGT